ncbi:hypothetical protein Tco_0871697 [Tanacetum coccineum]
MRRTKAIDEPERKKDDKKKIMDKSVNKKERVENQNKKQKKNLVKGKWKKKVEDDDEDFVVEEQKDGGIEKEQPEKKFKLLKAKTTVQPLYDATNSLSLERKSKRREIGCGSMLEFPFDKIHGNLPYQHAFDRETLEMHAIQFGLGEVIKDSDEENANETEIRETKIKREAKFQSVLKEKREFEDLLKENMEMDELFKEDERNDELSDAEKIQADCDMKATNIILQGLLANIYSLVNHHRVAKDLWERVQLLMQGFAVLVVSLVDDPIACLNMAMAFLTVVASLRVTVQQDQERQGQSYSGTGYKSNATSSGGNNASGQARDKAMFVEAQEAGQILDEEQLAFLVDQGVLDGQAVQTIIPNNAAFQTENLDTYDSDCDDISNAKVVLMINISNYGSDVISEVLHSETYLNDMENQSVHAMQDFKQSPVMDFTNNEIHSDSNIISYS